MNAGQDDMATAASAAATSDDAPAIDRDLTIYNVADLKPRLQAWLDAGGATLSLALAEECDSAGLQLLVAARRAALARGRRLGLCEVRPNALEALRRTGLDTLFPA